MTNDTTYLHDPSTSAPAPWAMKVAMGVAGTVALTGGLSNLAAVALLSKESSRRKCHRVVGVTSDTVLVLQLALVDLLYCTVSLPLLLATVYGSSVDPDLESPESHRLCVAAAFIRIVNANVEFNTLGLVAVER